MAMNDGDGDNFKTPRKKLKQLSQHERELLNSSFVCSPMCNFTWGFEYCDNDSEEPFE
jgi:hypothetical protein